MLQKIFDVQQRNASNYFLHIEAGNAYIALSASDKDKTASRNFEFYGFGANDNFDAVLLQIKEQSLILKQDYEYTKIIWGNAYARYIPASFYDESINDFIYDFIENDLSPQKKLLCKNDLCAIPFLVDESKWNALHAAFPNAEDSHKYYEIITRLPDYSNDDKLQLLLIFYPNHFIITAIKNSKLQFVNTVYFSSGTDVVYYCLNAVRQLNTSVSLCVVTLSGLIDGDSTAYKEIYKYIQNIDVDTFENGDFLKDNFSEHPAHFFVPFFKYA